MKAGEIVDSVMEEAPNQIVVQLANGQRLPITSYEHGEDARGNPVLVLVAGKREKRNLSNH